MTGRRLAGTAVALAALVGCAATSGPGASARQAEAAADRAEAAAARIEDAAARLERLADEIAGSKPAR